jgi:K+-transporting ATPase A subunit
MAAFALMEYGPERSFVFAAYLLVWALAFLVAGVLVAKRRPAATAGEVLSRAGVWAVATLVLTMLVLAVLSFVLRPALP